MDQFSHLSPSINDDTNPITKILNFHPAEGILKSTMKDNLVTGNNNNNNNDINHEINENSELINKQTEIIHNCIESNQVFFNNCTNAAEDNEAAIIHDDFVLTTAPSVSIDDLNNYEAIVQSSILLNTEVDDVSSIPDTDFTNSNVSSVIITSNSYDCIKNYNALATVEHDKDVHTTANIEDSNKNENFNNLEYEENVEEEEEEVATDIVDTVEEAEEEFETNVECIIKSDAVAANVANILQENAQDNIEKNLPKAAFDAKTQQGYTKKRKRRRIVLLNDEESSEQSDQDENEKDREILLKDETHTSKILLNVNNTEYQLTDITDIPQQIFENEKPKPKSKKISTKIIKEFEARALIQSAVLIQAIDSKKKKIRVLDSDDDDDNDVVDNINETDLTDIGLVDPICTEDISIANILMNEDIINSNFQLDEIPMDKLEKIIPIENPIIEPLATEVEASEVVGGSDFQSDEEETEIYIPNIQDEDDDDVVDCGNNISNEQILTEDDCEMDETNDNNKNLLISADITVNHIISDNLLNANETTELYINGNDDPHDDEQNYDNNIDLENDNSTNNIENVTENEELDLNEKDPFLDYSSSTSEEYLPNDLYFGTPDKLVISPQIHRGRPRGRPPIHHSQARTNGNNNLENNIKNERCRSVSRGGNTSRRGRPPLTNKINNRKVQTTNSSSSSELSSESNSKSDSISSTDAEEHLRKRKKKSKIRKRKKYSSHCNSHKSNETLIKFDGNREKRVKKSRKHDRFYDRSRDIPNQIYFGDVQVPLHVLHSYGVTSESTLSSDSDTDYNSSLHSQNFNSSKKSYNSCSSSRDSFIYNKTKSRPSRSSNNSISPCGDDLIKTMRRYLKLAGIKGVKFNRLWEGCKSNQERADKIVEVLHEHGLKGEPSSAKCRELRKQIITKREIEDLDPNAIINSEGRSTRRSITRAATRRNYTYDDGGEAQQALKKLRNFVDSDSEIE